MATKNWTSQNYYRERQNTYDHNEHTQFSSRILGEPDPISLEIINSNHIQPLVSGVLLQWDDRSDSFQDDFQKDYFHDRL